MAAKATCGPTQPRSLASFNRMITAARRFMLERGNENFTLQEVSITGKVSIGSIYHRFSGKEDLVRAVIRAELALIATEQTHMIGKVQENSNSLAEYVPNYVTSYAELLRKHSLMLSLAMKRASFDVEVSGSGDQRATEAATEAAHALLGFRSEITGDAETKARITFRIVFATIARHLSLDTQDHTAMSEDWQLLIEELSCMALSYLSSERSDTNSHRSRGPFAAPLDGRSRRASGGR